jgi:hypothetical protein
VYLGVYPGVRQAHLIIHAVTWSGDPSGTEVVEHQVRSGDPGTPLLNPAYTIATLVAGVVYGPVRAFEARLWKIVQPAGSPLRVEPPLRRLRRAPRGAP